MHRINELWIYPVKSLQGISVAQARVCEGGLEFDREWMVVDAHTGAFMSQRTTPKMSQVETSMDHAHVHLSAAGHGVCSVELEQTRETVEVMVWRDRVGAWAVSPEVDAWLSEVLGCACRLVRRIPQSRHLREKYTKRLPKDVSSTVRFADGFPFLVLGSESLAELNRRLEEPVSAHALRPNILVQTDHPSQEDQWERLRVRDLTFFSVKLCDRCNLINILPRTGAPHPTGEPLRTLATYRRGEDGRVYLGHYVAHRGEGWLRVGDVVDVMG